MLICVSSPVETIPLDDAVERLDKIARVKEIIQIWRGYRKEDQRLFFCNRLLEDDRTLASYNIQNNCILELTLQMRGGTHVFIIETSSGRSLPMAGVSIWHKICNIKARIQQSEGIPVNEQRLSFNGKELFHGSWTLDDYLILPGSTLQLIRSRGEGGVDISAVQARRRARRFKSKGTGDQAEVVTPLPEVGSKRACGVSSSAALPLDKAFMSSGGAKPVEGLESYWDDKDIGLAWRRSQSLINPNDTKRFVSKDDSHLIESVANDCVQMLNVTAVLESRLKGYNGKLSQAENEVKRLTEENARLKEELQSKKDRCKKLKTMLDTERKWGITFVGSANGEQFVEDMKAKAVSSAIEAFKKSAVFQECVMDRAVSVYDDAVRECQRLLRKSGKVSEDIIQLIDPLDSHQEKGTPQNLDHKEGEQEDSNRVEGNIDDDDEENDDDDESEDEFEDEDNDEDEDEDEDSEEED